MAEKTIIERYNDRISTLKRLLNAYTFEILEVTKDIPEEDFQKIINLKDKKEFVFEQRKTEIVYFIKDDCSVLSYISDSLEKSYEQLLEYIKENYGGIEIYKDVVINLDKSYITYTFEILNENDEKCITMAKSLITDLKAAGAKIKRRVAVSDLHYKEYTSFKMKIK